MHHGVGDEFADQDDGVVDDLGQAPAEQRVADEAACGGGGAAGRFEGGGCARGDHVPTTPLLWSGLLRSGCSATGGSAAAPGAAFHPTFRFVPRGARAPKQIPGGDSAHGFGARAVNAAQADGHRAQVLTDWGVRSTGPATYGRVGYRYRRRRPGCPSGTGTVPDSHDVGGSR
ncbi:hypothetical protein GCM10009663_71100 [Kitasatospora arboriphila]|uniref:Uncharacterized protein n=1 Tax=Kitasatospora arboriphila TaxID=258052 RepID=A0ABP4ENP6_9ACTN